MGRRRSSAFPVKRASVRPSRSATVFRRTDVGRVDPAPCIQLALGNCDLPAVLVNVDNDTLRKIFGSEAAMAAVLNIEGFRALGSSIFETVVDKAEAVKNTKKQAGDDLPHKLKKELSDEEKEYKGTRKQIQDAIPKREPELFTAVTGLSVEDFNLHVYLGVFNSEHMNQAVFAFRRGEVAWLSYTGIDSHEGLRRYGLYDTVVAFESAS